MIPKNNEPREYTHKVDFTSERENWGLRGELMLHVKAEKIPKLIPLLEWFELTIRPHFGIDDLRVCVIAECRTCIGVSMKAAVDKMFELANILIPSGLLTYKEGEWGYHLRNDHTIHDKWSLDDGMC